MSVVARSRETGMRDGESEREVVVDDVPMK